MSVRILPLAILGLTGSAFSQSALLRVGDPAPNDPQNSLIVDIAATRVNAAGGFGVHFTSEIASIGTNGYWGSLTPGAGALLLTEGFIGGAQVVLLDDSFNLTPSGLTYAGLLSSGDRAGYVGTTSFVTEDDPIAGTGSFFSFVREVRSTDAGVPYFVAGIKNSPTGYTIGRGLFRGTSPVAVFQTGDMVPNLPAPLSTQAVDFGYSFSRDGAHLMTQMSLSGAAFGADKTIALDGAGIMLGGALVREGSAVPTTLGGVTGQVWGEFEDYAVNSAGNYVFTSDTSDGGIIVRDGALFHRDGDVVDGEVLTGSIIGTAMNESGTLAYIWEVEAQLGMSIGRVEALFIEDRLITKEGLPVDWDGDGTLDQFTFIREFRDDRTMSLSDDGALYFTAAIDINTGTPADGYFVSDVAIAGTNYCGPAVTNSANLSGTMGAFGSRTVADNDMTLTASNLPPNQFGIFVTSMTQSFVPGAGGTSNGNICLGGAIGRFFMQNQILSTGANGRFSLQLPLGAFPQGNGFVAVQPGQSWNFQAWHRDTVNLGSNFTDGIQISFQ